MSALLALPVTVPLIFAGLAIIARRHERLQMALSISALTIVLGVATVLLFLTDQYGLLVLKLAGWPPQLGITLVLDRLSALMLVVSSIVTLLVLIFASAQQVSQMNDKSPVPIFHPTYLILVAGVSNAFLAGDLFNLYVGFEILLTASYVLLTLGATRVRIRAGIVYVVVSLVSSLLFLIAIAAIYMATGTVNLAELAVRLDQVPSGVRLALEATLLVAFGIKAALWPLSTWLPDSYPTAPAPVTAVFSGLLTKVGIYAIIRTETLLFPESDISTVLFVVAGASMLIGILGAVAQTDLKRVLSFTLVSHMGFMVYGIAMGTLESMKATVFYVTHHITVQTALFLTAGLIEDKGGSTNLARLGGLARSAPLVAVLFFIPAMNLSGIPPFSGFLGKLGLLRAGVAFDSLLSWTVAAIALLTSLLTLYAIAKIWNRAFWHDMPADVSAPTDEPLPRAMVGATSVLIGVTLALTVFGGPLWDYAERAGANLMLRTPYVSAVLGEDAAEQLVYVLEPSGEVGIQ